MNTNPPSSVYRIPPRPSVAPPPIPYNEEKSNEPLHSSHQLKKSTAFHLQLFDGGLRESADRRGLEMASFKTLGNQSSFRDYREQGHHVESVANGRLWQGNEKGSRDCFPAGEAVDREEEVIVGDDEYVEYLSPYSEEDEATTHEYVQYLSLYTSEEDPDTDEPKLKVLPILNREDTELSKIKASLNIAENTLNREKRLGEGQFGEVIKGTWRPAKEVCLPVAIKEIKSQDLQLEERKSLNRELTTWYEISKTPGDLPIVRLYGVTTGVSFAMVTEYMVGGTLQNHLKNHVFSDDVNWEKRTALALQMVEGLKYLHQKKIIHGDLKSDNILIDRKGRAKLGDFGLAVSTGQVTEHFCAPWAAPELFKNIRPNPSTDLYSFGMVLWEMTTAGQWHRPFKGMPPKVIKGLLAQGHREVIPPQTPEPIRALIEGCWSEDPNKRPTLDAIQARLRSYRRHLLKDRLPHTWQLPLLTEHFIPRKEANAHKLEVSTQKQGSAYLILWA